jgi:hypothetical protein
MVVRAERPGYRGKDEVSAQGRGRLSGRRDDTARRYCKTQDVGWMMFEMEVVLEQHLGYN